MLNVLETSAQKDPLVPDLIPPSPTASSLGKYTDFPVSLYNGVPSISIPITQLKSRNISVPITLNYHASGLKVGEVASWVGLGWSLDAGGLITRTVKGLPDEPSFFETRLHYPNPDDISYSTGVSQIVFKTDVVDAAKGKIDFEPDIYMLNAMGKSYKMLFKSDGTILTIPRSDLKITADLIGNTWEIILEDGTKLAFGGSEFTEMTEGDASNDFQAFGSSWYLKSITSQQGDVVNFAYQPFSSKIDAGFSQSDYIKVPQDANILQSRTINSIGIKTTLKVRSILVLHLTSITSELGKITFVRDINERQDLPNSYALTNIILTSTGNAQPVEEYKFTYNYSTAVSSIVYNPDNSPIKPEFSKRLKLMKIERKVGSILSQPWIFEYNPASLPSRRSFAQDHWGFYNGAVGNNTLLPEYHLNIPFPTPNPYLYSIGWGFMPPSHNLGANREPDGVSMKAEILTSIQYPTGGKSSFNFEPNGLPATIEPIVPEVRNLSINGDPSQNGTYLATTQFRIAKEQYIKIITFNCYFSPRILQDLGAGTTVAGIQLSNIDGTILWTGGVSKGSLESGKYSLSEKYFNIQDIPQNLPNPQVGSDYILRISTNVESQDPNDFYINADVEYKKSLPPVLGTKLVGGIRINKMTTDNGFGEIASTKKILYEDPFMLHDISIEEYLGKIGELEPLPYTYFIKNSRNSSTKYSLGSIQGGNIGYGKVTSISDELGTNGKTISIFSNVADGGTAEAKIFPYPPINPKDHLRGILMRQTDYRSDNTKIREVENFYDFPLIASISGVKTGFAQLPLQTPDNCALPYNFCGAKFSIFKLTTEQVNKTKTVERTYDNSGITNIETTTQYFYENPNYTQVSKTISTEGKSAKITVGGALIDSRTIETTFKYPFNYPSTEVILTGMKSANIISPVIEKTTQLAVLNTAGIKTLTQLAYEKTTFYKPLSIYLPQKIEVQNGTGILQTAITFDNYDAFGNLLGYTQKNGLKSTFTYYGTSDLGKVNLVKTQTNNLGHTTTYDYLPLVGLSLITDSNGRTSSYTYDAFNRLNNIKDANSKVVKSYQYNYYNQ